MGIVGSRLSGFGQTMMMDTDAHIHYRDTLQKQWTTMQAAGRLEATQQGVAAGAGGGMAGGVAGSSRGWAGMPWYTIGSILYSFTAPAIVIGGIAILVTYLFKASQPAMFASIMLTLFFTMHFVLWITASQRSGILTGRNFMVSLFGSMIGSGILAFLIYDPDGDEDDGGDKSQDQRVVFVPAGAAVGGQQQVVGPAFFAPASPMSAQEATASASASAMDGN